MKNYNKLFLTLFLPAVLIFWSFGPQVIEIDARKSGSRVKANFAIQDGYGVQKDGPHKIILYRLRSGHTSEKDMAKKIKKYGKKIKTIQSFTGITAREDKKYFSSVNPVTFTTGAGEYAIGARVFYCSFSDKFCSMQQVHAPVK